VLTRRASSLARLRVAVLRCAGRERRAPAASGFITRDLQRCAGPDRCHTEMDRRRRQQQVIKIVAKDADAPCRSGASTPDEFLLDGAIEQALPCVVDAIRAAASVARRRSTWRWTMATARAGSTSMRSRDFRLRGGWPTCDERDGLHRLAVLVVHLELFLLVYRVRAFAADTHLRRRQLTKPCAEERLH